MLKTPQDSFSGTKMERTERMELVGGFGMTPSGNLMHTEWLIPKPWPDRDDCDAQRVPWVGSFAILEAHRRRLQPTAPSLVCAFGVIPGSRFWCDTVLQCFLSFLFRASSQPKLATCCDLVACRERPKANRNAFGAAHHRAARFTHRSFSLFPVSPPCQWLWARARLRNLIPEISTC